MSVTPSNIKIAELDYDQILANLVAFMKTDTAFADYDFAGSGLRLLSRVLAYVIFYQNYYLSAAVNESFLDTAQLRTSVASHARMLGYDIHGTLSARFYANTYLVINNSTAASVTLPRNTRFQLQSNSAIAFYNIVDVECTRNTSTYLYEATDVELVEGTPLDYRFVVDTLNPTQRFIIPNANIDYTTISVSVQTASNNATITAFARANDYLIIEATDPVFFVQESYDGYPELKFGNGVVGKALEDGNIIIASYYINHGADGNNIRGPFTVVSANISGFSQGYTYADANTTASLGGSDVESLDDVRFMAPMSYQMQNRCVTADDYKTAILQAYGESVGAINVFGGEEGDPNDPANRPLFGRVFVVVKPKVGLRFMDVVKQNMEDVVIKPRAVIGVIPSVIDPDYVYLNIASSVKYDNKLTTKTKPQLQQAIITNILNYAQNSIEKFDTSFYYSKFTSVIDNADPAIVSSLTRIDLEKRVYPLLPAVPGDTPISNHIVLKYNSPFRVPTQKLTIVAGLAEGTIITVDNAKVRTPTNQLFTYTHPSGEVRENCFLYEENGNIYVVYRTSAYTTGVIFKSNARVITASADLQEGAIVVAEQSTILPTTSHRFTYVNDAGVTKDNCYLYEWGGAVFVVYRNTAGDVVIHKKNVGTVDTAKGIITLSNFAPSAIEGGEVDIRVRVIPTLNDFTPRLNQLFTTDETNITIQLLNAATATADDQRNFFTGGILP